MKVGNKSSLADKIAGILNTAPSNFDPEDDVVDDTSAKVLDEDLDDDSEEEEILSKFRKANVDLLADLDEKYAGKKTSRKNLRDSESEDEDLQSEDSSVSGEDSGSEEKFGKVGITETNEESEDEGEEEESESGEDEEEEENESDEDDIEEENPNFKHMSETNVSNQIKKGLCVRNQMSMWESLLEVRIQLQKCLLTANKMPQKSTFQELKQDAPFSNKITETKNTLSNALDNLLLLQRLLLKQYPETKKLGQEEGVTRSEDPDDEEIPSDTEEEKSENEEEPAKKKLKLSEYETQLSQHHQHYKDYRNNVIRKWNDKTRVVVKGGATSHSVLEQIEYNLSNKEKLVKRTQLKRSQYKILGEDDSEEKEEEHNTEIFDDDDFYHQLLRELIEVKSADVTDPVQLGRQWIQLQNMRSKMKRKIDTRATKGRKIRYAVHSKLVNFMAPIDENSWTDEAKTELYSSLFGKNQPSFTV